MKRGLCLLAAIALGLSSARAQPDGDFSFGDMDGAFDVLDEPLDHASDLDLDFEADGIVGLNLGSKSLALLTAQGFRVGARRRLPNLQLMLFSIKAPLGLPVRKALGVRPQAELFVADVFSTHDDGTVSTDAVRQQTQRPSTHGDS